MGPPAPRSGGADGPVFGKDFFVERQVAREFHLDDAVDAGIIRQSKNRSCEIVLLAVENEVGAEVVRNVSFLLGQLCVGTCKAVWAGFANRSRNDNAECLKIA